MGTAVRGDGRGAVEEARARRSQPSAVTTRRAGRGSRTPDARRPSRHTPAPARTCPPTRCSSRVARTPSRPRAEARGARGVLCSPKSVRRIRAGGEKGGRDDPQFVMTRESVSRRRSRLAPGGAPEVHSERDAGRMDAGRLAGVDKKNHLSYLDGAAAPRFRRARSRENRLEGVRRSPSVSRSLAHAPGTDASQSHADRPPPPPYPPPPPP